MNTILLGNLISLAGAVLMVVIGFIKRKEKVLAVQCVQFGLMGVGNLVLGGVTGALSNLVSLVRNLVCCRIGITVPLKLLFIAAQAGLSLWVNTQGLIGLLPVIAASIFTWFLDVKSDFGMKILLIGTQCLWLVYDFTIMNYVSFAFDIMCLCSNGVGLYRIYKSAKA